MSETVYAPTHFRLLAKLKSIGPYLREPQSQEGLYYFDCLSVCVDDTQSPEVREFWGWWMELKLDDGKFFAKYYIGQYDKHGNWQKIQLPEKTVEAVYASQQAFHQKLTDNLIRFFQLELAYHPDSFTF